MNVEKTVHIAADSPTEHRNLSSIGIDAYSTEQIVDLLISSNQRVLDAVQAESTHVAEAVELGVRTWLNGGTIHYVGAGTSGRLGVLDSVELLPTYHVGSDRVQAHLAGGTTAMMHAVEGAEDDCAAGYDIGSSLTNADLLFGITASGRTPFVGGALRGAREVGAVTILLASNPHAQLAAEADLAILPDTGPELITGSTRMNAATAQKIILNTFSTAVMVRCGKTFDNLMVDMVATNEKLQARMIRIICQATGVSPESAWKILTQADGQLRLALIMAFTGSTAEKASAASEQFPPDAHRQGDPSGIRTAVAALKDTYEA
ncbi:MAG: N-acetylmuramic acid 6-phosphate etherase [Arcanobacterium sp.]|nr:N-acetylmuramic acid 6-phosphate etherase [Arcanobacterium sp.]